MKKINTVEDLYDFIYELAEQKKGGGKHSLEEYLRALWTMANRYKDEKVTGNLLAHVIAEAFEIKPLEFNEQWLRYDEAYSGWEIDDSGYLPRKYDATIGKTYIAKRGLSDFELLEDVILCQIADLYRMKDMPPEKLAGSYQSPTGNYWGIHLSFGVFNYLKAGIATMVELNSDGKLSNWADLAILLHFARLAND